MLVNWTLCNLLFLCASVVFSSPLPTYPKGMAGMETLVAETALALLG